MGFVEEGSVDYFKQKFLRKVSTSIIEFAFKTGYCNMEAVL